MDLEFAEEQQLLRHTIRSMCESLVTSDVVRRMEHDERGYLQDFWSALRDGGFLGLRIGEAHGGVGMTCLDAVVAYEELGRRLAGSPHFESSILAARMLTAAGAEVWLADIASGAAIVIPAWQEVDVSPSLECVRTALTYHEGALRLTGRKMLVPFARCATRLLVVARHPLLAERHVAVMIEPAARNVSLRFEPNHADAALFSVEFTDVAVVESDCVGLKAGAGVSAGIDESWDRALLEGIVVLAGQAIGGAERALESATAYAKERKQFDRPIGSFQSIAHSLADRATEIEGAKVLVYQAAWAIDNDQPFERLAAMAKLKACAAFRRTTAVSIQIHGGIGFTKDADPQLYFRRAKHQQLMYGDPAWLEERIAASVFNGNVPSVA
jgi:alkylation response protein AidB-like acyl-CoA dehydrogenase